MQTNSMLRKGFSIGIIFFISFCSIPITGCVPTEKHTITQNLTEEPYSIGVFNSRQPWIDFSGTMGDNGWFVSDVIITIYCMSPCDLYYVLHWGDPWIKYNGLPINVSADGLCELYVAEVYEGQWYFWGPYVFKIDKTAPEVIVTHQMIGLLKWRFVAYTYDKTSGMNRVAFYIDNTLISVDEEYPYNVTWSCNRSTALRLFIAIYVQHQYSRGLSAIGYDNAGNYGQDNLNRIVMCNAGE